MVDGRITEVAAGRPPADSQDLGDVAILPRLVNAHTHLEFSSLNLPVGEAGISLADWIGLVVQSRIEMDPTSKQRAIKKGLDELWLTGTILAGEIMTPPCQYPAGREIPSLVPFAEVLGLDPLRAEERMTAAAEHLRSVEPAGCSPHAPYSITPADMNATIDLANQFDRPVAMHVAESPEERELLSNASGPLAHALRSLGVWRDGLFPWGSDAFEQIIESLARAKSGLLIHGNQLNLRELDHLAGRNQLTVVYCPRTHHFFQFDRHPVNEMLKRGIRVALGTDSRASNPDLDLWREVQFLLIHRSDLNPADVIRMSTQHGAQALGHHVLGVIQKDCLAQLGFVRTEAKTIDQVYHDLAVGEYVSINHSP